MSQNSNKIQNTIKVTVDKSHLLILGERMYVESIELMRELVNNAYDADATEVFINITAESIAVEDNGSGMDEKGLAQFFTIGSEEKRIHSISPRFGRKRIGQFGIGKFAALAAADRFTIESRKGKWLYTVVFDKDDWKKSDQWHLPIIKEPANPFHREGTRVTLLRLRKKFSVNDIERYLKESMPLRAKKFSVYLNNKKIVPRYIPGKRFRIEFKTMYGLIEGEIVIALNSKLINKPGIECRVKQSLVKYEFFGLDKFHHYGLNRITGSVNADFLPILVDRTNFIEDNPEYQIFYKLMRAELGKILSELKKEQNKKYLKKITKELKEVVSMIYNALEQNPDFMPVGRSIAKKSKRKRELVESIIAKTKKIRGEEKEEKREDFQEKDQEELKEEKEKIKKEKEELLHPQIMKKIRLKKFGISVGIVSLGADGPESISEGNLIYINQDHPLYQKIYNSKDKLIMHLLRLISQEIVILKKKRISAKEAFEIQSKIITAAVK